MTPEHETETLGGFVGCPCATCRAVRIRKLEAENERLRASALPDVVPDDVDALLARIKELDMENTRLRAIGQVLENRLTLVKALHCEDGNPTTNDYGVQHWCVCGEYYPCPTLRAAEGKP